MSHWLPTSSCTPAGCAGTGDPARHPVPAAALLLAGCFLTLTGALFAPLVLVLPGRGLRERLIRCWAYAVVRAFGVRVRVVGPPAARDGLPAVPGAVPGAPGRPGGGDGGAQGVLVVANHVSWLDIPLVATVCPGRMLAKSDIRHWPLLGPLAALGGTLFVERERLRALPATVGAVASALRSGSRVVVFPEGSTWCGRGPGGRFRPAAFQAAIDAGATVQPLRIRYRGGPPENRGPAGAAAFVGDDPLTASLWRVVTAAGLTAEIRVLPQIPADGLSGRRALARLAQSTVASDSANLPAESVHH
ncbi:2-acyl-glycerophospho-ethanolamine acyltransferase [Streptomyces sp. ADI92-24]|uniref:lysophospholipid acyltransferase family protein n=1 Tax=unclassified Streptomyces TaxID=2593676 RepID=UPI000F46646D|nr:MULTISPECIES: lysophospholipid acyltransferase family protein [unclassified Streptomyces]ROQ77747.1 1-acyl-sn-glycerol-3-phosphate acyltransferase [Streptomyces sp. CEV 2-1]RPK39053.1 2-acyl-glycerophospho-ethanolamine acyltransferase [Streptomyces sp. ADI92-24]